MRILLIKPHRLGDVLQALPTLRALRLAWPGAEIDFLVAAKYHPLLARLGLAPGEPFLCLQPGSNDPYRRWPGYPALAAALAARGRRVLVLGAREEAPLVASICSPHGPASPTAPPTPPASTSPISAACSPPPSC